MVAFDEWKPTSIVHVKYVCTCALLDWPGAIHVYDPIDIFNGIQKLHKVDMLLAQTSLAARDLRSHPPIRALGQDSAKSGDVNGT